MVVLILNYFASNPFSINILCVQSPYFIVGTKKKITKKIRFGTKLNILNVCLVLKNRISSHFIETKE